MGISLRGETVCRSRRHGSAVRRLRQRPTRQVRHDLDTWGLDHFEWYMGFFYLEKPRSTSARELAVSRVRSPRPPAKDHDNDCDDGKMDKSWAYHGAYYWASNGLMSYYLHATRTPTAPTRSGRPRTPTYRIAKKNSARKTCLPPRKTGLARRRGADSTDLAGKLSCDQTPPPVSSR